MRGSAARHRVRGALVALTGTVLGLGLCTSASVSSASVLPSNCAQATTTVTCSFAYTGAEQMFDVPAGVIGVTVTAVGAAGGHTLGAGAGGAGGTASAVVAVTPATTVYVEVGGASAAGVPGWNGGGVGAAYWLNQNGGGASDVRTISCGASCATAGSDESLASRLVVAGGGGSGGLSSDGCSITIFGGAGGAAGNDGMRDNEASAGTDGSPGQAGTSDAGGAGGTAGTGNDYNGVNGSPGVLGAGGAGGSFGGGAGGGGYYGGGGAGGGAESHQSGCVFSYPAGGGGGGSSYAPGGTTGVAPPGTPASVTVAYETAPTVTSFSPKAGAAGTRVTLVGTGLAGMDVDFAGAAAPATIDSQTPTKLVVDVPPDATTGPITVKNTGDETTTTASFTPLPKITLLDPADGIAGTTQVTITGTNLTSVRAVKFGTLAATPSDESATSLKATVPASFSSGKVTVVTATGTAVSPLPFEVTKVAAVTPLAAVAGATLTISGQGLGSTQDVVFTGAASPVAPSGVPTPTSVKVVVPADATAGPLTVETPRADPTTSAFTPLPNVTSLGAYDGKAGDLVQILGTTLTGASAVEFGTVAAASVTPVSASEVDAVVPGTPFSSGKITVTTPSGHAVSAQPFAISKVTGMAPVAAVAGATVTITGQGLGSVSAVDFVGHAGVTPSGTPTPTAVKVIVPDDALPGHLTIHTPHIPGGLTTAATFEPGPAVTDLNPLDGKVGTAVMITGTNFFVSPGDSVKFGTIAQPLFTIISANEIVTTVPAGFSQGPVTVTTPAGTAVSKQPFAITKITGMTPSSGVAGSIVTITGQGLGSATGIVFSGSAVPQTPVGPATPTAIKVAVPSLATDGPLVVHTPNIDGGGLATASFKVLPKIDSFSPGAAHAGAPVLVVGSGFEPAGAAPTVRLGTTTLTPESPSTTGFTVTLPASSVTGVLTVTTANGSTSSKLDVVPTISSGPTPDEGTAGTQVTLTGLTFTGTTSVKFADGASTPFVLSGALGSTQTLTFTVPATAAGGPITVTNAGGATATAGSFRVDPAITSFTPASGPVGATVTVKGTGFTGANAVTFGGGVTGVPSSVGATSFNVVVPQGVSAGPLVVSTATGGVSAPSPSPFTPTETLSSFAPVGGAAGTPVTIMGVGFTNVTDVTFGSTSVGGAAHFVVVSPTQISTTVPDGATDGPIAVVRSSAPASLTSVASFLVLSVSGLSATSVHEGDSLTITGTNLTNTTTVTFQGDVDATPSSVTSTTVHVTVPGGVSAGALTVTTSDLGSVTTPSVSILAPEISSIAVTNAHVGSTLQIAGAGFVDVSSIEIGGTDVTGEATSVTTGEIDLAIPQGDGGAVVVTTDAGTTDGAFSLYDHKSGVANDYWTTTSDTFQEADAEAAATVWNGSDFTAVQCSGQDALQSFDGSNYATWVYGAGTLQGYVVADPTPTCPTTSDVVWN